MLINAKRLPRADTSALATIIAIVLALLATGAVYVYLQGVRESSTAGATDTSVIVAKQDIPAGSSLGDLLAAGAFTTISVPENLVVPGAITDLSQLEGTQTADAVLAGEQIPISRVEGTVPGGTMGIPRGYEAVSIPIDANRVAGGSVRPGDNLAIYGTFGALSADGSAGTVLLVPSAKVLTVNGQASGSTFETATGEVTLTFALKGADAQKLIFAKEQGSVWMALLAPNSQPPSRGLVGINQVRP